MAMMSKARRWTHLTVFLNFIVQVVNLIENTVARQLELVPKKSREERLHLLSHTQVH